jgi:hypothetical protein
MLRLVGVMVMGLMVVGCSNRPTVLQNSDPALAKKSIAELSSDAVKRFPYPADAEKGGRAMARAQVGYWMNVIELVNQSKEDWNDVTVWVNRAYVINIPKMQPGRLVRLPFKMLYNDQGQHFPEDNKKVLVQQVELYQNGKLYEVPLQLAD